MHADHFIDVDGLRLHYVEAGAGEPVLLLHGWPTSSFLWREVMGPIAARNRVLALDLPGFGQSDKPLDRRYDFAFFTRVIDRFLDAVGVGVTHLVVHDLGGPIGLHWASQHPQRLGKLALLNTVVYPVPSFAVVAFIVGCRLPLVRSLLASPWGLRTAMRIGIADPRHLTDEVVRGVQAPFATAEARRALTRAGSELSPRGMSAIARWLPSLRTPVRVIYGARDRILPDVAKTMRRVARELPQAEVTVLPDCGHFLQEERPAEVGALLATFLADGANTRHLQSSPTWAKIRP